jgi:DNA invertase Pin-like site-specific DNA recombinase
MRCAIYTRKSTEEGLEQEFNTLDAQRDSDEAYIRSQREHGWVALPDRYDDGGYTGANMERPALKKLLQCEMIAERTRDKMSAARRKGRWVGGIPMLGYEISERGARLVMNEDEAARVRAIFDLYLEHGSLIPAVQALNRRNWRTKEWTTRKGTLSGGKPFIKNRLYNLLTNIVYIGKSEHGGQIHDGEHEGILDPAVWQRVQDRLRLNGRTGTPGSSHGSKAIPPEPSIFTKQGPPANQGDDSLISP